VIVITFRERLSKLRSDRGLSQGALAQVVDVSYGLVGHWETGRNIPAAHAFERLVEVFELEGSDRDDFERLWYDAQIAQVTQRSQRAAREIEDLRRRRP
jgi:transcriptional regulator with XRE-family HTH domain